MSIHGELSTLEGSLNESQYKLIRGLLTHNIGENTEHILPSVQPPPISAEVIRQLLNTNLIENNVSAEHSRSLDFKFNPIGSAQRNHPFKQFLSLGLRQLYQISTNDRNLQQFQSGYRSGLARDPY